MTKSEQANDEIIKDMNVQTLWDNIEVRRRWADYFEQVLDVQYVMETNINVVGDRQMPVGRYCSYLVVLRIECKSKIGRGSKGGSERNVIR